MTPDPTPADLARRFVEGARRALGAAARPLAADSAASAPRASAAGVTVAGTYEGLGALAGAAPAHLAPVPAGAPDLGAALEPALAALSSPAFDDGPFADAREAVRRAADLARAGDGRAARAALVGGAAMALMVLPDRDRETLGRELLAARFEEGLERLEAGEAEAAAGSFQAALAADPRSGLAFEGVLLAAMAGAASDAGSGATTGRGAGAVPGWVREALEVLDEAAKELPLGEATYLRLAGLAARAGADPVRALERGLAQMVVDPATRVRLLSAALRFKPAHGPSLRRLGFAHYIAGDAALALEPLEAAARAGEDVSLLLGLARLGAGDRASGIEALAAHVAGDPQPQAGALLEVGRADLEAGRLDLAAERLGAVTSGGDPYRTRALVLFARMALERGDLDEADRLMWEGPDTCEAESIEMFDRLAAALRRRGGGGADLARAARAEKEAADMRALPPAFREFGFISNPLGQPAIVARDEGGRLYRGHRRSTGESVLLRGRAPHGDDVPGRLPPRAPTPFVLEPVASGRLGPRFWTIYPDPGLTPLSAVLERSREKARAIAPVVLRGLAAALCDIAAAGGGLVAGFLVPERILLTSASGPLLLPFDPLDAPFAPGSDAPAPAAVAPEVASGGPGAASPASDVFGLAAVGRQLLADGLPPRLAPVLDAAGAADPAARPSAEALLVAFLRFL